VEEVAGVEVEARQQRRQQEGAVEALLAAEEPLAVAEVPVEALAVAEVPVEALGVVLVEALGVVPVEALVVAQAR